MPGINSRNKGSRAERNVAKLFEAWTGRTFAKTPSSGGLQWKTTNSKGDIVCTKEGHFFPFCIEVKFHSDIRFEHFMLDFKGKKSNQIHDWWAQCSRDAKIAKKVPMLLMRYNGMPADLYFVVFDEAFARECLGLHNYKRVMDIRSGNLQLTILRSDEFFKGTVYTATKIFTKDYIKKLYK